MTYRQIDGIYGGMWRYRQKYIPSKPRIGAGHMEGNAKEENQPSKKDDLPADIFSSVLEVLEVLGIANYSILIRVSSVFTLKI